MVSTEDLLATREVTNQAPPLVAYNAFREDRALAEALHREGAGWAEKELVAVGERAGGAEAAEWGRLANQYPPVLRSHDRFGNRIDEVEYHPAYHELLRFAVAHGMGAGVWAEERPGAHVARAAKYYLWRQVEAGHTCPLSLSHASLPGLRTQADLAARWEPFMVSRSYDGRLVPVEEKGSAIVGMAMTERQGGSDVRANTTRAVPLGRGGPGAEYAITGHKWFCSAPMSDAFLVLAQAPGGLSCFLLPRILPDGRRNAFHIERLKDKLGDRSNASSEVEFAGALAILVGEEGRGVPAIMPMVTHTRLDCAITSAADMRAGAVQALHHAAHRKAFGRLLADQPLMRNVLADLALESEAAMVTALRLARAFDAGADEGEAAFRRMACAVAKYWICKRALAHAAESLECLGGNGFVEESGLPRLYRQTPLNSIWEGSGNVICLDVLRAAAKDPVSLEAFWAEVDQASGADARLDAYAAEVRRELARASDLEGRARRLVERLALALQGSLLVRHAPAEVADAFCASRLAGDWGHAFGTLPGGLALPAILDRARPKIAG